MQIDDEVHCVQTRRGLRFDSSADAETCVIEWIPEKIGDRGVRPCIDGLSPCHVTRPVSNFEACAFFAGELHCEAVEFAIESVFRRIVAERIGAARIFLRRLHSQLKICRIPESVATRHCPKRAHLVLRIHDIGHEGCAGNPDTGRKSVRYVGQMAAHEIRSE